MFPKYSINWKGYKTVYTYSLLNSLFSNFTFLNYRHLPLHWGSTEVSLKRRLPGELPGSLVVGTQCSHCCDRGSLPGGGTKMLKATHKVRPREEKIAFFFSAFCWNSCSRVCLEVPWLMQLFIHLLHACPCQIQFSDILKLDSTIIQNS